MRRGRQAKPTRFVLQTIQFPPSPLDPPSWLEGYALEHWQALAPFLHQTGRLTMGDRTAFEMLCVDYALIRQAEDAGPLERVVRHPRQTSIRVDANTADAAKKRYLRWLREFGLTPSSRARIKSTLEPSKDKLGSFFDKHKAKKT
jgi:P27 family predicted phage terminase small subunit